MLKLKEIIRDKEKEMQCNCDLDNWQPKRIQGIHRYAESTKQPDMNGVINTILDVAGYDIVR